MTKLRIQPILAGILTMTALYSVNLRIQGGRPNISMFGMRTIFTDMQSLIGEDAASLVTILAVLVLLGLVLYLFLHTQLGLSLRATGSNEAMVRASSINADRMKLIGLALANGIIACSGALLAQYQSFADVSSSTGKMVLGLASIIVGRRSSAIGRSCAACWRGGRFADLSVSAYVCPAVWHECQRSQSVFCPAGRFGHLFALYKETEARTCLI
ncbi:MAG: ABC transporter permease subunit [Merdibacter sp.]